MKRLRYGTPEFERETAALYRRPAYPPEAEKSAAEIIADIRKNGDKAVAKYAEKFDGVKLAPGDFRDKLFPERAEELLQKTEEFAKLRLETYKRLAGK